MTKKKQLKLKRHIQELRKIDHSIYVYRRIQLLLE